ncbi:Hypothetical predicted protein, partial [Mytilus galloprovincialis]
ILSDFNNDKSPTKDEIGELESDIDIDDLSNKDERFGILADFDNDKCPTKDVIGEFVSDIYIDESHKNDKSSAILSDIETDTTNTKDKIDCLVVNIDVDESPNKDQVGELLVDVDIDKSLSNQDNKMKILTDIDIIKSVDSEDKMDEILSDNDIDNNQYQDSDILKKNEPLLEKSKDKHEQLFALDDDQRHVEQSNKIIQDYNEKFRSLGEQENDSSKKQGKPNENEESDLLAVDLRDTPYSSDEYIDDESDVSVEEIEEERCDILKQLDLSTYVINDASRKQQLPVLEENTSPEFSVDDDDKIFVSDTSMNSKIKDEETNKNSTNDKQISKGKVIMNDTSVNEKQGITCDDKEFEKRHGTKKLQQLHSMSSSDEIYDESIGLESLSDTRPALPNTLFIGDNQSLASLMGRIAAETSTQQNASPPELEDMDFTDFVNILAVVPGKDARILLSPISEEGTVSQIAESIDSLSPEAVEEHPVRKPKRPSLIDLTVTDTDGVVERINLQNIDVLQSFSKPCNFDPPIETGMEQIPRIVKGPSSITAIDSEEIILEWTITGFPEPEVVIFKDGETLDICDGITLENDKNTWTLQIPYGMKDDAGLYEICAVNSSGNDILKTRVYVKSAKNSPVREDEFNNDLRLDLLFLNMFYVREVDVEGVGAAVVMVADTVIMTAKSEGQIAVDTETEGQGQEVHREVERGREEVEEIVKETETVTEEETGIERENKPAILNVNVICRPRSESDTRGQGREEPSSSKIDVKSEEIKPEVKEESGAESEDDLSLSSISSDEEFEADHDKKHSIDALDIDWASLQQDVRPKPPVTGSALNRFKASNVFAQIGVSKQYAGEELFNKIQNECIKQEDSTDVTTTEEKTEDVKPDNKFRFKSDIAVFHSSITSKNQQRKNLLRNIGPFRRALCARRDLEIRRQLCKVDKTMDHIHSYPAHPIDQELYKLSVQLFRQSCPEKPEQIKQEVTSS